LELGAGCGPITRYLGENYKHVDAIEGTFKRAIINRERCRGLDNVRIFCSDVKNLKLEPVYDAVFLVGVLEYAPLYFSGEKNPATFLIELAKSALKPDGTLVIAIENKIGIKYFSGCPEDHNGKIYSGIHGYPQGKCPVTFSKKEIKNLLGDAGFKNIFFNYCFPDYKFLSTIFNDNGGDENFYLHNWIETPFSASDIRVYTFDEALVIKTLSEAGLMGELANSFLIMANQRSDSVFPKDWIAKKFSTKRRKKLLCSTTLKMFPEIHIEKKRLLGQEEEVMFKDKTDTVEVKHKIFDSRWIGGDLMIFDFFKAIYAKNIKEKFTEILKIYYQELIKKYSVNSLDGKGYPLLRGVAVDFVPRNIIKKEGKLFSIDDEWTVGDHIPADYCLFRAINDVLFSQQPRVKKKIKNVDKFTIEIIKYFFPNYNTKRYIENITLEKKFQNTATAELFKINFINSHKVLTQIKNFRPIRKLWNILPEDLKFAVKKMLFNN